MIRSLALVEPLWSRATARPIETVLLGFAGLAAYQAWTRWRRIRREAPRTRQRQRSDAEIWKLIESGRADEARSRCRNDSTFWGPWIELLIIDSPAARLQLEAALRRWRSHLPILGGIATAATLLGLLGTIAGLFRIFENVALQDDPTFGWSAAISSALITTQLGLAIALPTLAAKHWLGRHLTYTAQSAAAYRAHVRRLLQGGH